MEGKPRLEEEIFHEALTHAPGMARERFLRNRCGADSQLCERVMRLLRAAVTCGEFLEEPAFGPEDAAQAGLERTGSQVGPYLLVRKIGEGGYGVVYLAEQSFPLQRRVALKVIRKGMDTERIVARFETERQVLALLDHPGIAKIFDAGSTETGAPYFAMEYVEEGMPIHTFADTARLTIEQRLELMIQVCQAVQHAHQKGVIHRDLKPSNILVAPGEAKPHPKIIDFGVAKAAAQIAGPYTLTMPGQLVGTPAYMSPEQLDSGGADVDTRTDVYSLGVVLHQILAGSLPFEPQPEESPEAFRRRTEGREPRRPSTTFQSLAPKTRTQLAASRGQPAPTIASRLRGDLDAIVLKAIARERARRYESPAALGRDLERVLRNEPVNARAPGAIYLAGKFVRRHRTLSFAAALILLCATTAGLLLLKASRKERAALEAAANATGALRINLYTADMQLASQAYAQGDYRQLRSLLATHQPDFGDRLEWRLFHELSRGAELWSQKVFDGALVSVASISDGKLLSASTETGPPFAVLERSTGKILERFGNASEHPLYVFRVSPDSRYLIVSAVPRPLEIWDLSRKELIYTGTTNTVRFAFHPTQTIAALLVAKPGKPNEDFAEIQIFDLKEAKIRHSFQTQARAHDFSSDGQRLVTARTLGAISVWNWSEATLEDSFEVYLDDIHDVRIVPGRSELFRVSDCCGCDVVDYRKQQRVTWIKHLAYTSYNAEFNRDGSAVAVSTTDQAVFLYETKDWTLQEKLAGHGGGSRAANFTPDGKQLVTAGADGHVRVFDIQTPTRTNLFGNFWLAQRPFSPDGRHALGFRLEGAVEVWDLNRRQKIARLATQAIPISFGGPRSVWLGDYSQPGSFRLEEWSFQEPDPKLETLFTATEPAIVAAVLPERGLIGVRTPQGPAVVNVRSGERVVLQQPEVKLPLETDPGRFSADGSRVAFSISETSFCVWDAQSGRLLRSFDYPARPIAEVILTPEGDRVIAAGLGHEAHLWEVATGKLLQTYHGHRWIVRGLDLSRDGKTLATASWDRSVRLFDVVTGRSVGTLECAQHVDRVAISPQDDAVLAMDRFNPRYWLARRLEAISSNNQARE